MNDMVKVEADNGETVEVSEAFAKSKGLTILPDDEPAKDRPKVDPKVANDRTFIRARLEDGTEVTVSRAFAASRGLTVLEGKKAVDRFGVARNPKPHIDLRGKELDAELKAAGLSTDGKLAEKQARLAEFQSSGAAASATNNEGVSQ